MRYRQKTMMDRMNTEDPDKMLAELEAKHSSVQRACSTATPWQEGYMEGRAASGDVLECPHAMDSKEAQEWMRGFDAGRDDARQGV
jgi:hypothetical protein